VSNENAISAVTSVLQRLLETRLHEFDPGTSVTTKPPDRARMGTGTPSQLNLFLFQATLDGALRNMDPPRQVRPGEVGYPALPLQLHYLITAYGVGDDDVDGHKILGRALGALHDMPILDRGDPRAVAAGLNEQIENIRITPESLSLEELSKLWTTFQSQYRISAAFVVSAVLIDSTRAPRSALPVLTRGPGDQGVAAVAASLPVLSGVVPPRFLPAPRLGDILTLLGSNLAQSGLTARFSNFRLATVTELTPLPGASTERLTVALPTFDAATNPTAFDDWAPGIYTAGLVVNRPGLPSWSSNEIAFALAPSITVALASSSGSVSAGDTVTIQCVPHVREDQTVRLLFGDRQVKHATLSTGVAGAPSVLTFEVPTLPAGDYPLRLRVDGADSSPTRAIGVPPRLEFDPEQTVTVA
jgi:hypothetical protein